MREILIYIENAKSRIRLNAGEDVESVERRNAAIYDLRVHELALQSLSQEAVRDEVLEEAARVAELFTEPTILAFYDRPGGPPGNARVAVTGKAHIAPAIRALKREPNAAGPAGQESWATPSHEGHAAGPAPAAPDVASMVKQRLDNDDAYLQGFEAGQLARLGQGWIPVSERLPQDDTSPVLVNYRAAFHTRKFASGKAKRHRVMFAIFSGGKWRFTLKHEKTRLSERVTHWMPLPPAPGASDD